MKLFAERLKLLIGKQSVNAFAGKVGIPPQTIHRYIRGERTPNGDNIVTICKACEVSADWILGISDKRPEMVSSNSLNSELLQVIREEIDKKDKRIAMLEARVLDVSM